MVTEGRGRIVSPKLGDGMYIGGEEQRNAVSESCSVVSNYLPPHGLYSLWNSPGQNTGVGSLSLLQGIFSIQGSNPALPHWRWIIYQLSHRRSPIQAYHIFFLST